MRLQAPYGVDGKVIAPNLKKFVKTKVDLELVLDEVFSILKVNQIVKSVQHD